MSMSRDDRVQVEHARLQHLAAAEREQLPRERRGARGGLADLVRVAAEALVVEALDQELAVAGDGRQQVVEVVGDATRQPPDRLHLLRLPQLLLEGPLVGEIANDRDMTSRPHVRGRDELDAALPAVGPVQCHLRVHRPFLEEARPQTVDRLLGHQLVEPEAERRLALDSEQLGCRGIQVDDPA